MQFDRVWIGSSQRSSAGGLVWQKLNKHLVSCHAVNISGKSILLGGSANQAPERPNDTPRVAAFYSSLFCYLTVKSISHRLGIVFSSPSTKVEDSLLFAASTHSHIYHFVRVEMRTAKTVCGLRVAMIIEPKPVSAALHLVSTQPDGYSSCAHCNRMSNSAELPTHKHHLAS